MASDVTISNALNFAENTANSSATLSQDFDDFLVLLTTQLQNQDPLDPADSSEFTSQLVQFAGVEQSINTNQKLDALVSLNIGSSFSSALNYVGKDISYISAEGHFNGTNPVKIAYAINGDSVDTTINVFDEDGTLIFSEGVSGGATEFTWDGKDENGIVQPSGTYEIRVDALDGQNASLSVTTVVTGHVSGIETQNGTTFLLVGSRAVSLGNIINVVEPTTTSTADTSTDTSDDNSDNGGTT
ncbi:MAG: flagellar hook capping family protein [Alphaproteobacteria bacterium]|nr:MAG: flagellar hook capping family protein [Alphaproteobacteria bacterium]